MGIGTDSSSDESDLVPSATISDLHSMWVAGDRCTLLRRRSSRNSRLL